MKTRHNMILIGTVLAMSALSLPFIISETSPKPEIPNTPDLQLIDKLIKMGCNELTINHLIDYSNLLDKEFNEPFFIKDIGLPADLLKEDFDKCLEIAISMQQK